ncbi:serine hydrolase domain-containing protein [Brumimicrobium mesophilum]|uniref:serine hydrolase domain-containing protein n=1 Tax=Brumimicrobium mesophilum TaxID=392717 RepID=UPI000D14216C|nr:serine hydrolase [Brumimicrobium mesophilum]
MKYLLFILLMLLACKKEKNEIISNPNTPNPSTEYYFPPINSSEWDVANLNELGYDLPDTSELYDFLSQSGTRAFILMENGKIAIEKYWGNNILNTSEFSKDSQWYWASAGKTITSFLLGLAQEDGLLNIENKTSEYLGNNWTNMVLEKENLISVKHQLTMTTGLDYNVSDLDCTSPSCLTYKENAGDQWYYHNAPYTLLKNVVENATGISFNAYTDQKLESTIGMQGNWLQLSELNVYSSTARDAARFGSLLLNNGEWDGNQIMTDQNYFESMVNSSQTINPSYGYLFWLNGKSSVVFPGSTFSFNQQISDNAPQDLYAALGKNGQFILIIPSRNMVVIRMGESPDNSLVPIVFHDLMWEKINEVIN